MRARDLPRAPRSPAISAEPLSAWMARRCPATGPPGSSAGACLRISSSRSLAISGSPAPSFAPRREPGGMEDSPVVGGRSERPLRSSRAAPSGGVGRLRSSSWLIAPRSRRAAAPADGSRGVQRAEHGARLGRGRQRREGRHQAAGVLRGQRHHAGHLGIDAGGAAQAGPQIVE